jgi:pyruvate dehydrogenase E2 component (dihydrolipoamide acetyltransferase)
MKGSGPNNRIIKVDVENDKLNNKKPLPEIKNNETISGIRSKIAEKMVQSHLATVHYTLHSEVSVDEIVELRGRLNLLLKDTNIKIPYDLILAIICAEALQNHPNILVQLQADQIITKNEINIGIAVDTQKGLMVPVLKKINKKSLKSLAVEMDELIDRIKKGKGTVEDFSDGVFTISNLGLYRISSFTPIINYPESAILGIGKITKQPIVRNNQIDIANMMTLSLTYDHRLIDGAPAARFLQLIGDYIESPGLLFFQRET